MEQPNDYSDKGDKVFATALTDIKHEEVKLHARKADAANTQSLQSKEQSLGQALNRSTGNETEIK